MKTLRALAAFVLVALFMSGLTARAKVPPLLEVPDNLPADVKRDLNAQRADLEKQIASLRQSADAFNAKFGGRTLSENDPLAKASLDEKAKLIKAGQDYALAALAFDDQVSKATPITGARTIPASLSPDMERAIATALHDAPPGVADRVRKGFQSIINGDWKTAEILFEDAQNHDSSDANLKGLVAQFETAYERQTQVAAGGRHGAPAANAITFTNTSAIPDYEKIPPPNQPVAIDPSNPNDSRTTIFVPNKPDDRTSWQKLIQALESSSVQGERKRDPNAPPVAVATRG